MEIIDQIIKSGNIGHAYLFCGPKGVNRMNAAIYFAKSILCKKEIVGGCNNCIECTKIDNSNHWALAIIEPDGKSIKIQQIKDLQYRFSYKSVDSNYQIYIIEEANTLTSAAANNLLKFLEEPTGHTIAILLVEQPGQVLATIASRCQIIRLQLERTSDTVAELIQAGINEKQANFLGQIWLNSEKTIELINSEKFATIQKIMLQLTEDFIKNKQLYFLLLERDWFGKKATIDETEFLLDYMLYWFRELLVRDLQLTDRYLFADDEMEKYQRVFEFNTLQKWTREIIITKQKIRTNINTQIAIEAMLLKMQEELMCIG